MSQNVTLQDPASVKEHIKNLCLGDGACEDDAYAVNQAQENLEEIRRMFLGTQVAEEISNIMVALEAMEDAFRDNFQGDQD